MTPAQLEKLQKPARAFADAVFKMKAGCGAINFENGIVVYVNDASPGAAEFRKSVKALLDAQKDASKIGTF